MEKYTVALTSCKEYDVQNITEILTRQFEDCGITAETVKDKNIVLKPNLVMNKSPEHAATTHPAVFHATIKVLKALGADPEKILVAESFGGPYVESLLKSHYKNCGIAAVAETEGIKLNFETGADSMFFAEGVRCKKFNIIDPIRNADIVVDLCKLKTHSLTKMSNAIKNFFGTIPGVEKFEMHARFSEHKDFTEMIVDLCEMICKEKTVIAVCDGVIGMEGNGPTGGNPKDFGVIMTSLSPFALDVVAAEVLDFGTTVPIVESAKARGLAPNDLSEISVMGNTVEECKVRELKLPDSSSLSFLTKMPTLFGGRYAKFFQPHPEINRKTCIGCGKCAESCPVHTIEVKDKKAKINREKCIRCYCCQELCPINSVKIKKNIFLKLIQKL